MPALHDDQFGAATVVAAGVLNALTLLGRKAKDTRAVVNGIGAAGTAAVKMLQAIGIGDILAVDRAGILRRGDDLAHSHWREIAASTNAEDRAGDLAAAMRGADLFVGLSAPRLVTPAMVRSMNPDPIVFGLANPEPEILPHEARAAGAAVAASGRFDFPNQCNNVLAFPGLMRGTLDSKARRVSLGMCLAAAHAIAGSVPARMLTADNILPSPLDGNLHATVAEAVAQAAMSEGLARITSPSGSVAANTKRLSGLVQARQDELQRLSR